MPYGMAYWILFNWLPAIVTNYRYLCEQSEALLDSTAHCVYVPPTDLADEGCIQPKLNGGWLPVSASTGEVAECTWTAGFAVNGSTAYIVNTLAMFAWFFCLLGG